MGRWTSFEHHHSGRGMEHPLKKISAFLSNSDTRHHDIKHVNSLSGNAFYLPLYFTARAPNGCPHTKFSISLLDDIIGIFVLHFYHIILLNNEDNRQCEAQTKVYYMYVILNDKTVYVVKAFKWKLKTIFTDFSAKSLFKTIENKFSPYFLFIIQYIIKLCKKFPQYNK